MGIPFRENVGSNTRRFAEEDPLNTVSNIQRLSRVKFSIDREVCHNPTEAGESASTDHFDAFVGWYQLCHRVAQLFKVGSAAEANTSTTIWKNVHRFGDTRRSVDMTNKLVKLRLSHFGCHGGKMGLNCCFGGCRCPGL